MAGISKRVNGSWVSGDYGIMKTATDTITTLPANIYPNATTATVGLKGNMVQNGTPSPTTPIQPSETGERTVNLADISDTTAAWGTNSNSIKTALNTLHSGTYTVSFIVQLTERNDITDGSVCGITINSSAIGSISVREQLGSATVGDSLTVSCTITLDSASIGTISSVYLYGCGKSGFGATGKANIIKIMLNLGSQPLPYEPFGFKIPISSANTTTPICFGEVETTRQIKKLVLTGEESTWSQDGSSSGINRYRVKLVDALKTSVTYSDQFYISHYERQSSGYYAVNRSFIYNGSTVWCYICVDNTTYPTVDDYKTYIAQQYANGTPVTIWYVLAEPTTGIVNEPIRKIGDYADTLSNISIPVTAGGDTLSVDTTLQPSEVTVNYKGWHPAIVHERTNGAWT